MFEREDILAIWEFNYQKDIADDDGDYDESLVKRGKELHEQGYYVVTSDHSPVPNFPFEVRFPNGKEVPKERLLSEVHVFEGGYVAQSRTFYGAAIVKKVS